MNPQQNKRQWPDCYLNFTNSSQKPKAYNWPILTFISSSGFAESLTCFVIPAVIHITFLLRYLYHFNWCYIKLTKPDSILVLLSNLIHHFDYNKRFLHPEYKMLAFLASHSHVYLLSIITLLQPHTPFRNERISCLVMVGTSIR